ncbi:MAG: FkbM family methyltransferase [Oscillatoriales cyanobacterium RM2_1_1]|nr:FkbM family methyltransferase [Oscillatoriales cyanobacterium SM2_3_0]NJO47553.1 FkbM family methyltransferase [Oscillatoriales cyanobacterium RM2_1_1]
MTLREQITTITHGVGAGLQFNAGPAGLACARGTYEMPLQRALAQYLKPAGVFYDIGANVGFFTAIAAKLVGPAGQVYAFEPVPENAERIHQNIQLNQFRNVGVLEKAVSNTNGQGILLLADHCGGATLATAGLPPDLRGKMTVDLVRIDDLVSQARIKPPTVVKVDVEGAEIEALEGMGQTLGQFQPVVIYEVDDAELEAFQYKFRAVAEFLQTLNYQSIPLEAAYPGIPWHVGHAVALPGKY